MPERSGSSCPKSPGISWGHACDYYVVTNFAGFEKIIDILGGVDIDVENPP
jgi:anionic cell wall polymer biosynthesis LytR-Cps2A-Psr (LCP) family protein